MKKRILFAFFCLSAKFSAIGQVPQAINYQAIARDGAGLPLKNMDIVVEFSVLDAPVSGTAVFREKHQIETNDFGLFTLEIGRGAVAAGSFAAVDWGSGNKFLKVEINGSLQGTTQLLAVPYALFASATDEKQQLSIAGNKLSISSGNSVDLPTDPGGGTDYTAGPGISINAQNQIAAADASATNEIQTLNLAGNQLSLSQNGGTITLPGGPSGWDLMGNGGTNPISNFIGTTDDQPLVFKVKSIEKMRLDGVGRLLLESGDGNTMVGSGVGQSNSTGKDNSFFGFQAGKNNTTGLSNSFFGDRTGFANTTAKSNSFFGSESGQSNTTGQENCFFGDRAGFANTTANANTFLGTSAGTANTTGYSNCFVGNRAGFSNTTGFDNCFFGYTAGNQNTTGSDNHFFGNGAGFSNSTGSGNSFFGRQAGFTNSTGGGNVAFGSSALFKNTTGFSNTATGTDALLANTTGSENTATGKSALLSNTTGSRNTSTGRGALASNTTGNSNVAVGLQALFSNTASSNLVAVGDSALWSNTTGFDNTAIGSQALFSNTTGEENTALGDIALFSNTTGGKNTAVGDYALSSNTTGSFNTGIGQAALTSNKTGNLNSAFGKDAGPVLGATDLSNTTALGNFAKVSASNTIALGNTAITSIKGMVNFSIFSDASVKNNVQENIPGLAFIQKLRPVTYQYDIHRQNALLGIVDTAMWEGKYDIEKMTFSGFLAQEVEQAARSVGYEFSGVDAPKNGQSLYGLRYAEFTVPLVKAVQEQQQIIESQRQQLEKQGKMLTDLQARLEALEAAGKARNK